MNWLDGCLVISPVPYCLCTDEKRFKKVMKTLRVPKSQRPSFLGRETSDAATHVLETSDGDRCAVVTIRKQGDKTAEQVYALLVHEAVHIWQFVREGLGEDSPSSEFEAYSIQSISQSLMEEYREQVKK